MPNIQDLNLQMLADFFSAHPYASGIFTYLIVFIESMAVIGVIVPGAITMPAIGFLIGSAIIPAGDTFLWSILGALTGDCLSFWIGIYFKDRVHKLWPFTRWPNLLNRAEHFFESHGGKSVFIGRFVGPTRAMIPMVAGMLRMPFSKFLFSALPSACVWSFGYMLPGVLLGAVSLELPPKVATQFALWVLAGIVLLWIIIWLVQHFFKQVWKLIDSYILKFWKACQKYPSLNRIEKLLSDPKEPDNHRQLTLLLMSFVSMAFFLFIFYQVLTNGFLTSINSPIYHLLVSLRSSIFDYVFIFFTLLGDPILILTVWSLIFAWFLYKKNFYVAFHWLAIFFIALGISGSMKFFIYNSRPGGDLHNILSSSFPSAHVTLSGSFYGFLSIVLARELTQTKRKFIYLMVGAAVSFIAFTRLYLGVHWILDVFAGAFLALSSILLVTVSYRRMHEVHIKLKEFVFAIGVIILFSWVAYAILVYEKNIEKYTMDWPRYSTTFKELVKDPIDDIPLYRSNRLGKPIEAFNVLYLGDLKHVKQALIENGWENREEQIDLRDMVKNFSANLAIFPQLYHGERANLILTKKIDSNGNLAIFRLWLSTLNLKESDEIVWIGTVEYHKFLPEPFSFSRFKYKNYFISAVNFLSKSLVEDFKLRKRQYTLSEQPTEMKRLNWDGELLIVGKR